MFATMLLAEPVPRADPPLPATFAFLAHMLAPRGPSPDAAHVDWPLLLALADRHRVAPWLAAALKRAGIAPPPDQQTALARRARQTVLDELALAASARAIAQAFAESGIALCFLKGVPLSLAIHGTLGVRVSRDIDLLVAPRDVPAALDLLANLGFAPAAPIDRLARQMRRHKDIELFHPVRRQIVELHWRLFDNPHLLPLPDSLPCQPMATAMGQDFPILPDRLNLLYLASHGSQHGWSRLKWLADFAALLARRDGDAIAHLYAGTAVHEGRRALGQALLLCALLFGMALPPALEAMLRQDRRVRWLVAMAVRCMTPSGAQELEALRFGSTVKNLSHYLLSSAPGYLLAEMRLDLADSAAEPPGSPWRGYGPPGRLAAWLTRHGSLPGKS